LSKSTINPSKNCALCPRLKSYIDEQKLKYDDWHNAPVPSFGSVQSKLLIVGLAPGLKGANRTGRPFTGDHAGDLLYSTLAKFGFSKGVFLGEADDGLELVDCRITNAVRCVPPENRPTGKEVNTCAPFLVNEIAAMENLKVILALGGLSHGATLKILGEKKSHWKFAHNRAHRLQNGLTLVDSYHCSRYNTNTGKLTTDMLEDVFKRITHILNDEKG